MIQLWELLGRTCVQPEYLERLLDGDEPIRSEHPEHDPCFQTRLRDKLRQPHLSRAELTELYRLLKSRVFLKYVGKLQAIVREKLSAAGVPREPSAELLRVIGLSTIDTGFRKDVTENGAKLYSEYRFSLSPPELRVVFDLFQDPEAGEAYHAIHAHWSPPDCICGLSFSKEYRHPLEGGTLDVKYGKTPKRVEEALNHPPETRYAAEQPATDFSSWLGIDLPGAQAMRASASEHGGGPSKSS